jgi:hypothetical protein
MSVSGSGFPPPENPFQPSASLPPDRRSRAWLWLAAAGVLAVICGCCGLCVVPAGLGVYQAAGERGNVEQVVTAFMTDLAAERFVDAAERFSSRAKRVSSISAEKLAKVARENQAYQGGRAAHVAGVHLTRAFNSNQDVPQGVVANVSGTIDYEGGDRGTFRAMLEKESGAWRLHSIQVQRGAAPANATRSDF